MPDARLDLEVTINGVQYVAKGLDEIAGKSADVGKSAGKSAPKVGTLQTSLEGMSKGAMAASQAQNAMAQLMAGNFVGAFRSATVACKALWTAMMSNPLTALIAGITAASAAIYIIWQRHEKAAEAARKQAKAERELKESVAELLGQDELSVKASNAKQAAQRGDIAYLEKMRDQYRDLVEMQKKFVGHGIEMEDYSKLVASMNIYQDAIDELTAAREKDKAAEQAAAEQAKANLDDQISKEKQLAWEKSQDDEASLEATQNDIARERELYGIKDEMNRLLIRRKQLLQDMENLNPDDGGENDRKRLVTEQEIWKIDQDILKLKDDAKKTTDTEGENRKTAADDLKGVEETITTEKKTQLTLAERTEARIRAMKGLDPLKGDEAATKPFDTPDQMANDAGERILWMIVNSPAYSDAMRTAALSKLAEMDPEKYGKYIPKEPEKVPGAAPGEGGNAPNLPGGGGAGVDGGIGSALKSALSQTEKLLSDIKTAVW